MNDSKIYKIIGVTLFDPTKPTLFGNCKKDKALLRVISCNNSENCQHYNGNTKRCNKQNLIGTYCPYGKLEVTEGFTTKARKFNSWIAEQKENYKTEFENSVYVSVTNLKFAVIGDFVQVSDYLVQQAIESYFEKNKIVAGLWSKNHTMTNGFFFKNLLTVDLIEAILNYHSPRHWTDDFAKLIEIRPKFIQFVSKNFPEVYEEAVKIVPKISEMNSIVYSNIGREAVLGTVAPNVGQLKDIHGGLWTWDGETLTSSNSKASFLLISSSEIETMTIKPKDSMKVFVKITSDDQVTDETKFKD